MLIKELNKFDENTTWEIRELITQCDNHDGGNGMMCLDASLNFNHEMNTIFLSYESDKLVSALTLFVPGNSEAEVSAMTLPEYRLKGCFSELVKRAEAEMKKYNVPELLFLCEDRSSNGKAAVVKQGAKYEFTEYQLKYNHSLDSKIKNYDYRMKLHKATLADLESIIKISMTAFGNSYEGAEKIATSMLSAENRQFFLGEMQGEFIAMGVTAKEESNISIHGLGVLTEHQGKGYGKEMLYSIINQLIEQDSESIYIDVDSENSNAFQLYKNSGFEVENAWGYYRRAVE